MNAIPILPKQWEGRAYVFGLLKSELIDPATKQPMKRFIIAKHNCKQCYGRGFVGLKDDQPEVCICLHRNIQRYSTQNGLALNKIQVVYQKPKGEKTNGNRSKIIS